MTPGRFTTSGQPATLAELQMDSGFQRACDRLIHNEVRCCVSMLVRELQGRHFHSAWCQQSEKLDLLAYCVPEDDDESEDLRECLEHWVVTDWLAGKLLAEGERVVELFGLNIWGRPTSGQAISMDWVITKIQRDML